MKTIPEKDAERGPLSGFVAEYRARPENAFDDLPPDQQVVRLKQTVDYLTRRVTEADQRLAIADTTAANLHCVIRDLQQQKKWVEFLVYWVDYNHGKGESDRAWEEFQCNG
jgi:hypothetical protein